MHETSFGFPFFGTSALGMTLTALALALGTIHIVVSLSVNALLVIGAGRIAALLATRPGATIQRRLTGTLLGAVTVVLAREVPARARV